MSGSIEFTVIVPTRDRPQQLAECLEALARLDYPRDRFEVIVVDDGSGTAAPVVRASSLPVSYVEASGRGPGAARNAGARQAQGRYLAFTDDDCIARPGWLAALGAAAATAPDAMLGGSTVNGAQTRASELSQSVVDAAYRSYNADPADARFFAANNLAVPAAGFRDLGGFDESFRTAEDRLLCLQWRRGGGRLVVVPDAVVEHHRRLGLLGLWRQHYAYGQGAFHFHRVGGGENVRRRSFYGELVRRQLDRGSEAPFYLGLLALQQVANAAGYAAMLLGSARRPTDSRPSADERADRGSGLVERVPEDGVTARHANDLE